MPGKLDGKVAVVTGGASGMGLASVERFVAEGASVVFCDLPPAADAELESRLGELKASAHHKGREKGGPHDGWAIADRLGEAAHFVPADVSDREQLAATVEAAVSRYGRIDVMFNNAGIAPMEGKIVDCPEELFDRVIEVNLKPVWMGIKLAAPHLIAGGGGSILSTASLAALRGYPMLGSYSSAKAGVVGLTSTAAVELAPHNVRVNCICPGAIITPIGMRTGIDIETLRATAAQLQPLPRAGEDYDIAGTALWLASDDSAFVTGQTIAVDGGAQAEAGAPLRARLAGARVPSQDA